MSFDPISGRRINRRIVVLTKAREGDPVQWRGTWQKRQN